MRRRVLIAVLAGAALISAVPAQGAPKKTVTLGDNYYMPHALKVKKGTKVTWRWSGDETHNVAVTKGPVKFRSAFKSSGSYSKTVKRAGTYTIVCTIHQPDMKMKLRVTR